MPTIKSWFQFTEKNGCPSKDKNISQKHLIPWSKQFTCFCAPLSISIRRF